MGRACLIGEQVHGVRCVMPQKMIGPRTRLAERVHVGAAEEIGLHVHLQNVEGPRLDALAHELVARVEAPGVADHRDEAGLRLHRDHRLGVGETVGERDLDLHVLAGLETREGLRRVHLGRRGQDHRVEAGLVERLGEIGGGVGNAVFGGGLSRLVGFAPDQGDALDAVNQLDRVEMFEAEGAGAGEGDFDCSRHIRSSKWSVAP